MTRKQNIYQKAADARAKAIRMADQLRAQRLASKTSNLPSGRMSRTIENNLRRAAARSYRGTGYDIAEQIRIISRYTGVYNSAHEVAELTRGMTSPGTIKGGAAKIARAITSDRQKKAERQRRALNRRQNALFKAERIKASYGLESSFGRAGEGQAAVSVFYAATKQVWQGRPPSRRDYWIMKSLGVETLAEAYDKVIGENKEALRMARDAWRTHTNTRNYDSQAADVVNAIYWGDYINPVTR